MGAMSWIVWQGMLSLASLAHAEVHVRTPFWSASEPDSSKPLYGFRQLSNVSTSAVYFGSSEGGFYNHAPMMTFFRGRLYASWKNAPEREDSPGQRVLFAESHDGVHWSRARILFPNMSTESNPAANFAGPFATINGRLYASATPAIISRGDAQGAQFCLWPDGLDPRNCATPDNPGSQPAGLLMMRRIRPRSDGRPADLGPPFWVYADFPGVFSSAAATQGIVKLSETDAATRSDVAKLVGSGVADGFTPPCDEVGAVFGTLKCEGCSSGCQTYDSPPSKGLGLANGA